MKLRFKAFKHSVFLKLLTIIGFTGILITGILVVFYQIHFSSKVKNLYDQNTLNYFTYVAKEIGSPPDTSLARKLSYKYSLKIIYSSKTFYWSSVDYSTKPANGILQFIVRHIEDKDIILNNIDGSRFIFNSDYHRSVEGRPIELVILIIALIGVLTLNYLLIKSILKPIKLLSTGVKELSLGNFKHQIPVTSTDEFASLSDSFNGMVSRIKGMIHSRDRLLLDVSHELRSPITRIKLELEMMQECKAKESIAADIKEIEIMITEILESERLRHGNLEMDTYNIIGLIKEVTDLYNDKFPGITTKNLPATLNLRFDYSRMKIALRNIIENAVKYSHTQSSPIIIFVDEEPGIIVIKIKDDGIGVAAEDIPYLFEPFYRTDKSRSKKTGGFGLGLSICKQIIEAHKGTIEIKNNIDRGITVTIKLNDTTDNKNN